MELNERDLVLSLSPVVFEGISHLLSKMPVRINMAMPVGPMGERFLLSVADEI